MGNRFVTLSAAALYILSGIFQPLLVTVCKNAGLANPTAQLYMLFYYAGPSCLLFTLCCDDHYKQGRPSLLTLLKASGIASFDIAAQSLNYTGATWAGATIFSIIYSSVTVWTALFSSLLLGRRISRGQWCAVGIVFGGLCVAAVDGINLGEKVSQGTALVVLGSCMHGATYVMSEMIMKGSTTSIGTSSGRRTVLSVRENSAVQGMVACTGLLLWQVFYTAPRWNELIRQPMETAGTTVSAALCIFLAFGLANLFHSFSFYHTIAHFPGGSTSAGVMKGLQAVLVFVVAHLIYCSNDKEMCFSRPKFLSLCTVVGGVVLFSFGQDLSSGYLRIAETEARQSEAV